MKLGPELKIGMKRSHWSALVNMFKFNPEKHLFQCWLKYILTMNVKHLTFTIYIYKSHISILHGMTLAVMEIVLTINLLVAQFVWFQGTTNSDYVCDELNQTNCQSNNNVSENWYISQFKIPVYITIEITSPSLHYCRNNITKFHQLTIILQNN